MKKVKTVILICMVLLIFTACGTGSMDSNTVVSENGYLTIESNPSGADVYINGTCMDVVTPCTLALSPDEYQIEVGIPGFVSQREKVTLSKEENRSLTFKILPDIPEADILLIVNVNGDPTTENGDSSFSGTETLSFREAIEMANADQEHSYRIEFADNVEYITAGVGIENNIQITASDLTINGDRNMDGIPDVTMQFGNKSPELQSYITVCPEWDGISSPTILRNFLINGIRFTEDSDSLFSICPAGGAKCRVQYENIRVLNCDFDGCGLIAFGGACKNYGTGASGYGEGGCADYCDMLFCGNRLNHADAFFAYNGDCDYSIAENLYFCANTGEENANISVIASDCNTWYVFGPQNEISGFEKPETSDHNIVRNVIIRGNTVNCIGLLCADNGNSENLLEKVNIEKNRIKYSIAINPVQLLDECNEGQTLISSGNILRDVVCSYNVFEEDTASSISVFYSDGGYNPETRFIADNNQIYNISFVHNIFEGRLSGSCKIDPEIGVQYDGSPLFVNICDLFGPEVTFFSCRNNRIYGISYSDNVSKPRGQK